MVQDDSDSICDLNGQKLVSNFSTRMCDFRLEFRFLWPFLPLEVLTPIRESWKKKSKSREMSKRHSWKKIQPKFQKLLFGKWVSVISGKKIQTFFLDIWSWIFEKNIFRELSKRHFWKKNPDLKSGLDFFSRNDAYSFPEIRFFQKSHQNNWNVAKWIIFPEMTLPDVPKRVWIFFPEMTLAHFPDFRE